MVVAFVAMLYGLIEVAPVALLRIGQDQVGAFDFMLTPGVEQRVLPGDTNIYTDDPFKYDFSLETMATNVTALS